MRTDETRMVESVLGGHFKQVDAYRYNSASIRLRVVDPAFEALSHEQRDSLVEPYLDQLPNDTQTDIVTLFTFAPSELSAAHGSLREQMLNSEFENPSPSML
jgi:hypothetical protein